jgi:hypothetical protein
VNAGQFSNNHSPLTQLGKKPFPCFEVGDGLQTTNNFVSSLQGEAKTINP